MATIKSYTDLEQSKELAEILPLESADMYYSKTKILNSDETDYIVKVGTPIVITDIPCWSLAALLGVLPSATLDSSNDHYYRLHCMEKYTEWYNNPVDAYYKMIIKLHEQKLL